MTFLMVVSYTVLPHALLAKFERGAFFYLILSSSVKFIPIEDSTSLNLTVLKLS
ncbi:Uncharacterised protein [Streptococcus pyogenes]|nr:Uncharacterised protein [Streptococcus pyogenes]